VATDLTRIGEKARKEPGLVFINLYHHIYDVDNLRACYDALEAKKATGVDGVTKEEYGEKLEENLRDLSERLKRMGYRPEPKRRSYIPKVGSEKGRPLGISCLEDKIVEEAVKRTLEPICHWRLLSTRKEWKSKRGKGAEVPSRRGTAIKS
jgi:retron-type reverse transcriptase